MKTTLFALALSVFVLAAIPSKAQASFGCEVLLCLAASGGTPSECKPILKKLYKRLAKGKSFPSCKMESGPAVAGSPQASLPRPERGVAVFVPRHQVCDAPLKSRNIGKSSTKYCPKPRIIEPFLDHSGKSCRDWFPATSPRAADDQNRSVRATCRAGSKKWVKVQGGGVNGEYHYY
jgi:hypothetical protein